MKNYRVLISFGFALLTIATLSVLCTRYEKQIDTLSGVSFNLQKRLSEQASECGTAILSIEHAHTACVDTCMTAIDIEPDSSISYTCIAPYCDSMGRNNGYTCAFECTLTNMKKGRK